MAQEGEILKEAKKYLKRGWSIIPIKPKEKTPLVEWEKFIKQQPTEDELSEWFHKWPNANIALVTGKVSNLIVVDIDSPEGEMYYGNIKTVTSTTGRGRHLYFKYPKTIVNINRTYPGIDIQGEGAYVLLPPSVHPSGKKYGWINWDFIDELPIFNFPDNKLFPNIKDIIVDERNNELNKLLWEWQKINKVSFEDLSKYGQYLGLKIKKTETKERLEKKEIINTIESVYKAWENQPAENTTNDFVLSKFDDIQEEKIEWLWPGVIPRGKLSLIIGDPGHGKSLLSIEIAACVSSGKPFQDGTKSKPGNVLMVFCEDGAGDTVKPRLRIAGANLTNVMHLTIKDRWFRLDKDILQLTKIVKDTEAKLLIIDPISAYLGNTNSWKDDEVRRLLAGVGLLAEETYCAVLCIMHLNKKISANAIDRGMGSVAFSAVARSVFLVGAHPEEGDDRKILTPVKANLMEKAKSLMFRIESTRENIPKLIWDGETTYLAKDLLTAGTTGLNELAKIEQAKIFIPRVLAKYKGEMTASKVYELGLSEEGLSREILNLAYKALGGIWEKPESSGYIWKLKNQVETDNLLPEFTDGN